MGKAIGMSQSTVSRVWRAFQLKPHLSESFQLSTDSQFIEKVHDVVGLYLNPPAVVSRKSGGNRPEILAGDDEYSDPAHRPAPGPRVSIMVLTVDRAAAASRHRPDERSRKGKGGLSGFQDPASSS